jgi:hypothetical protein
MFNGHVTLTGQEGAIVWGYHTAAVCGAWTVARSPQGAWTLQAAITRADAYRLRQGPLTFLAPRRGGSFTWPVLAVTVGAGTLSAALGPPAS